MSNVQRFSIEVSFVILRLSFVIKLPLPRYEVRLPIRQDYQL